MDVSKSRSTAVGRGGPGRTPSGNGIGEGGEVRDGTASVMLVERPNLSQTRNLGPDGVLSGSVTGLKVVRTEDRKISRP